MKILRDLWRAWSRFGQMIGDFIGRLILTVFYITMFAPFGLGVRLMGDPLAIKTRHSPNWLSRKTNALTIEDARRTF